MLKTKRESDVLDDKNTKEQARKKRKKEIWTEISRLA